MFITQILEKRIHFLKNLTIHYFVNVVEIDPQKAEDGNLSTRSTRQNKKA
jgi:hypothetical protein